MERSAGEEEEEEENYPEILSGDCFLTFFFQVPLVVRMSDPVPCCLLVLTADHLARF